jgi:hypothetical protein
MGKLWEKAPRTYTKEIHVFSAGQCCSVHSWATLAPGNPASRAVQVLKDPQYFP